MGTLIRNYLRSSRRAVRNIFNVFSGGVDRPKSAAHSRGISLINGWPAGQPNAVPPGSSGNPLEEYFDSVTEGAGLWKWRHYFDIYHRHLNRFVGQKPVVVEVGVYSGGSMTMWHSYFGAGAHVHGIDIEPACRAYAAHNTTIHIGDQGDAGFWREFRYQVPLVDVLIDDGGHEPGRQMATVEGMLTHIRPGGVYICEDITGSDNAYWAFARALADGLHPYSPTSSPKGHISPTTAFQASIQSVHVYPFVVVIEKRPVSMPSFSAPKHGTHWQPYL